MKKIVCNVYNGICDDIELKDVLRCWSDSQISLARIKDVNSEFKTFVQNRLIKLEIMFVQIIGDIVVLLRIYLTLLRKLNCLIFQQTVYGGRDIIE